MHWIFLALIAGGVAIGANWLFRQRSPEEMQAAISKLRKWRNRSK